MTKTEDGLPGAFWRSDGPSNSVSIRCAAALGRDLHHRTGRIHSSCSRFRISAVRPLIDAPKFAAPPLNRLLSTTGSILCLINAYQGVHNLC
jgi:hypothetical protein